MGRIKFAVFSDLHYDHIHDGLIRMKKFVADIRESDVDFTIELGDFCSPKQENQVLLDLLDSTGKPHYHTLGNHDSDLFPREQVMNFLHMDSSYYAFNYGQVRFIVLDTCYMKTDTGYEPYCRNNYNKAYPYPILPDEQFRWLENQLKDASRYYVILSHHSFENEFAGRGVNNREDVRALINRINETGKRVLLCINGHDHGDSLVKIGRTYYFGVNSMSYIWLGQKYEHYCYSGELHRQYPYLKDMILYREGLYSIITITESGGLEIRGMRGHYQNISPKGLGLNGDVWNGRSLLPVISSYKTEE